MNLFRVFTFYMLLFEEMSSGFNILHVVVWRIVFRLSRCHSRVVNIDYLYPCAAQEFDAVRQPVLPQIDYSSYPGLYDKLRTLYAWRIGDIERSPLAVVVRACKFRDGVGLGMQHRGEGDVSVVLTDILEAGGCAVIAVRDDAFVLHHKTAHLATAAV